MTSFKKKRPEGERLAPGQKKVKHYGAPNRTSLRQLKFFFAVCNPNLTQLRDFEFEFRRLSRF